MYTPHQSGVKDHSITSKQPLPTQEAIYSLQDISIVKLLSVWITILHMVLYILFIYYSLYCKHLALWKMKAERDKKTPRANDPRRRPQNERHAAATANAGRSFKR